MIQQQWSYSLIGAASALFLSVAAIFQLNQINLVPDQPRGNRVSFFSGLFSGFTHPDELETATLFGTVTELETAIGISNAVIFVSGTQIQATTYLDGSYTLTEVPGGTQKLIVQSAGHKEALVTVSLFPGDSLLLDIQLTQNIQQPDHIYLAPKEEDVQDVSGVTQTHRELRKSRISDGNVSGEMASQSDPGLQHFIAPHHKDLRPASSQRDTLDYNTEGYDRIVENPFKKVRSNPLSTFSIDVDAASYANVRRYLDYGQQPPADAVRIEELINYFSYDYPQPVDGHPFSIITEISETPWNTDTRLIHVGMQGIEIDRENLKPSNLVFLIDVSGSMEAANKLSLVKTSLMKLTDQLGSQDRVAIVVYAGAAGEVLPSTSANARL